MLQAGGGLDLGEEALAADDGGELGVQDLDGDLAVVLEVLGEVDRGHAALAELALEAVAVTERCGEAARAWSCSVATPGALAQFLTPVHDQDELPVLLDRPHHDEALSIGHDVVVRVPGISRVGTLEEGVPRDHRK